MFQILIGTSVSLNSSKSQQFCLLQNQNYIYIDMLKDKKLVILGNNTTSILTTQVLSVGDI